MAEETANDTSTTPPNSSEPAEMAKGFVGSLFDLSFKSFITPKLIQVIYIILIVIAAIMTLGLIVSSFSQGAVAGIIALLLSPIIFLIYVLFARVYLELVIVLFRIYEEIRDRGIAG